MILLKKNTADNGVIFAIDIDLPKEKNNQTHY
jgi:hypothetical protein